MTQRTAESSQYVLLDTETGGLDPTQHPLLEIGARILNPDLTPTEHTFQTYIQPHTGAEIDARALEVNKLFWATDPESKEYKNARPLDKAWEVFVDGLMQLFEIDTRIVPVGWNVRFDVAFLEAAFKRLNAGAAPPVKRLPWPFHYHTMDLLGVVRFLDAKVGRVRDSYKLQNLAVDYFGTVAEFGMHTAQGDSDMALRVTKAVEQEYAQYVAQNKLQGKGER